LGGDFYFYSGKIENGSGTYNYNSFNISPSIGKAVKDNAFWGGQISFGGGKNYPGMTTAGDSKINSYGAGVFYRKYKTVSDKFYLFLQTRFNTIFSKTEFKNGPDYYYDQKDVYVSGNLYPGISYKVSGKLFLEAGFRDIVSISYTTEKREGYNFGNVIDTYSNSFSFSSSLSNFNSSLSLGFRLLLSKESKK
jgi:hypothetical protein